MTIDDNVRLAKNLKTLRRITQLSQTELAAKIGVCRTAYSQIEQGGRLPDLNTLHFLSDFYDIAMDSLINCDVQTVLSNYFMNRDKSNDERRLAKLYTCLSEISKGRLLERAEELYRLDILKREENLQMNY